MSKAPASMGNLGLFWISRRSQAKSLRTNFSLAARHPNPWVNRSLVDSDIMASWGSRFGCLQLEVVINLREISNKVVQIYHVSAPAAVFFSRTFSVGLGWERLEITKKIIDGFYPYFVYSRQQPLHPTTLSAIHRRKYMREINLRPFNLAASNKLITYLTYTSMGSQICSTPRGLCSVRMMCWPFWANAESNLSPAVRASLD